MTTSKFLSGSRIVFAFWLLISLGSCSITHYVNNSSVVYTSIFGDTVVDGACGEFKRTVRINHQRPVFPRVDVSRLTPDERTDLLLSYTERLKTYLDADERYLAEDMARHKATCQEPTQVFQK